MSTAVTSPRSRSTTSTAPSSTPSRRSSAPPTRCLPAHRGHQVRPHRAGDACRGGRAAAGRRGERPGPFRVHPDPTLTFSAEALSVMITMSPIDADEVRSTAGSPATTRRCGSRSGPAPGPSRRRLTTTAGSPSTRHPGPRALRVPARGRCPTRHHTHRGDLRERIRRDLHDHVTRLVEEAVLANAAGAPARAEALLRRAIRRLDTEADLLDDAVVLRHGCT